MIIGLKLRKSKWNHLIWYLTSRCFLILVLYMDKSFLLFHMKRGKWKFNLSHISYISDSLLLLCHFVLLHYCFLLLLGLLNHLCTDISLILDRYHPDKNVSNPEAAELFKEVAYSYSILSDPEKRRHYDNAGFEVPLFLFSDIMCVTSNLLLTVL